MKTGSEMLKLNNAGNRSSQFEPWADWRVCLGKTQWWNKKIITSEQKSVKKVSPVGLLVALRLQIYLSFIPLNTKHPDIRPLTSAALSTPHLGNKHPMDLIKPHNLIRWGTRRWQNRYTWGNGKTGGKNASLPKESGHEPKAKIIPIFHSRQQTARGKFKTNETLCVSQPRAVTCSTASTLCLWHQPCVEQNWVSSASPQSLLSAPTDWRETCSAFALYFLPLSDHTFKSE